MISFRFSHGRAGSVIDQRVDAQSVANVNFYLKKFFKLEKSCSSSEDAYLEGRSSSNPWRTWDPLYKCLHWNKVFRFRRGRRFQSRSCLCILDRICTPSCRDGWRKSQMYYKDYPGIRRYLLRSVLLSNRYDRCTRQSHLRKDRRSRFHKGIQIHHHDRSTRFSDRIEHLKSRVTSKKLVSRMRNEWVQKARAR